MVSSCSAVSHSQTSPVPDLVVRVSVKGTLTISSESKSSPSSSEGGTISWSVATYLISSVWDSVVFLRIICALSSGSARVKPSLFNSS